MIIAVDFDGILNLSTNFSDIEDRPNYPLIAQLIKAKQRGHRLILWTCRGGDWLNEAVDFCKAYGLTFDAVNENIKGFEYRNISCKVVADFYVDDKAPGSIESFMKLKF